MNEQTIENYSSQTTSLLQQGYDALRSGALASAEELFLKVLAHHPQNIDALKGAAISCLRQSKRRAAIGHLKTFVQLNPANTKYTVILASILNEEAEPADAVSVCLRTLGAINDKTVHKQLLKSLALLPVDHKLAVLQLLMDSGIATEDEYFTIAKFQVGHSNIEQAQFILDDALKNYPESAKLLFLRAKVKFETRNFKEAYLICSHLIRKKPTNQVYRYYLYRVAYELERYEEAYQVVDLLRQEAPNDYRYVLGVGLCLYQLEEYEHALQRLDKVSELLRNGSWRVLYNVGLAAARSGNLEKAKASLKNSIELNSGAIEPRLFLSNIFCDEQDYTAARAILVNAFDGFSQVSDRNVLHPEGSENIPLIPLDLSTKRRRRLITSRITRDSALIKELKTLYKDTCQICGNRISIGPNNYYSEVHHIRPLGAKHDGPDTKSNLIVLCPNHHTAFDYGCIAIHPDSEDVYEYQGGHILKAGHLLRAPSHEISPEYLSYYVKNIFLGKLE